MEPRTEKKVKRSRCRTCREFGVKAKDPRSGFKKLFMAIKVGGQVQADMSRLHVCSEDKLPLNKNQVVALVQQEIQRQGVRPGAPAPAPAPVDPLDNLPSPVGAPRPAPVAPVALNDHDRVSLEKTVAAQVAAAVAQIKPVIQRVVVIQKADGTELVIEDHVHPLFPRLLRYAMAGEHCYLYGAPGGGKTHACRQVARELKRQFGYLSLAPMTPESRMVGFLNVNGEFQSTSFFRCYTEGGIFCLDEADNANDALLTALNGALENNLAAFPDGMHERHVDFVLIATGNTTGYGGTRGHAGRRAFDAATRERFAYIPWIYDEAFEETLTFQANAEAGAWLGWVRAVRSYCAANFPDVVVSPRASIKGARMLAKGTVESAEELAEAVLFKGLEASQRNRILGAVPLPRVQVN